MSRKKSVEVNDLSSGQYSVNNLLGYSQNYSMTSGSLWNYYRAEINDVDANASDSKLFKYKAKIIAKTEARPDRPGNKGGCRSRK